MSTEHARSRARERIVRMCDTRLDSETLRWEAMDELRRTIGFNRWCWPLADPDSLLAHSPVAEVDFWPVLPRMFVLEQAGDVNAEFVLARSRYPSACWSAATGGDLARSTRWDQCLRAYGVGDALTTACRDAYGCWGWLEATRDSDDPPFDPADVRLLQDVGPVLGSALRRATVRETGPTGEEHPGPGVVILDERLVPASWTQPARAWLDVLSSGTRNPDPDVLPVVFHTLAARVLAGPSGLPAHLRFRTAAGRWVILDGAMLEGAETGQAAITVRAATPQEAVDLHSRAHGLTARERELFSLVLTGRDTRQLADELSISSYTVKDHLKAVFDKVGVRSRRELVAGVLGATQGE